MLRALLRYQFILLAFSLVAVLAACRKDAEEVPVVSVQVARVEKTTLVRTVQADAVLFPLKQAAMVPKVAAPVARWYVQRGDKVKKGQLLGELENADLAAFVMENRGGLEQAKASYAIAHSAGIPEEMQKAELDLAQAKQNLDAQQKLIDSREQLFKEGALPRKDLDAARVAYVQAKSQYDIAERHLEGLRKVSHEQEEKAAKGQMVQARGRYQGAEAQLRFSRLISPIDGYVTDRPNFPGEMPQAGAPVITVMDTSSIIAKAHISEADAALLRKGDKAEIAVAGLDKPIAGKVTQISPALDPNSTTVEIWVTVKNPEGKLRPGSAARVTIATAAVQGLAVPLRAVVRAEDGRETVAVVEGGVANQREVKTGVRDDEKQLVQIISGLNAGEVVVSNVAYALPDKTKVKIESAAPAEKPAAGKD